MAFCDGACSVCYTSVHSPPLPSMLARTTLLESVSGATAPAPTASSTSAAADDGTTCSSIQLRWSSCSQCHPYTRYVSAAALTARAALRSPLASRLASAPPSRRSFPAAWLENAESLGASNPPRVPAAAGGHAGDSTARGIAFHQFRQLGSFHAYSIEYRYVLSTM